MFRSCTSSFLSVLLIRMQKFCRTNLFLAEVLIVLGPCRTCAPYPDSSVDGRKITIQQYNEAINELVVDSGVSVVPPDFYGYFEAHPEEFF